MQRKACFQGCVCCVTLGVVGQSKFGIAYNLVMDQGFPRGGANLDLCPNLFGQFVLHENK